MAAAARRRGRRVLTAALALASLAGLAGTATAYAAEYETLSAQYLSVDAGSLSVSAYASSKPSSLEVGDRGTVTWRVRVSGTDAIVCGTVTDSGAVTSSGSFRKAVSAGSSTTMSASVKGAYAGSGSARLRVTAAQSPGGTC